MHCTAAADRESFFLALVRFLLPEGILDYFELSKAVEGLAVSPSAPQRNERYKAKSDGCKAVPPVTFCLE